MNPGILAIAILNYSGSALSHPALQNFIALLLEWQIGDVMDFGRRLLAVVVEVTNIAV